METTHKRTNSNPQIPSRPTTPLRPSSRTSLRSSTAYHDGHDGGLGGSGGRGPWSSSQQSSAFPLAGLEGGFAELADGMADLEANFMHLQLLHESLARFGENFAAFLYGLNVNAFCVDFPEAPLVPDSFRRARMLDEMDRAREEENGGQGDGDVDPDMTIVSTATSFVDHPSTAGSRNRFTTPAAGRRTTTTTAGRGAGSTRGASRAGSAASGRGAGRTRASGIARGTATRGGRPGAR